MREAIDVKAAGAAYRVLHRAVESVELAEFSVDHVITDPPYDDRTQANGRKLTHKGPVVMSPAFSPMNETRRNRWAAWIARVTRGVAVVFSDHESSMLWANDLERYGMEHLRCGLWVRTGDKELTEQRPRQSGAPQFTGDRPAAGHEVLVICRARGRGYRWRGGGKPATYTAPVVRGAERYHETQKPVSLMREILTDFVAPGELVCDPFAGAGTTLVAAKNLGMPAFGIELDGKYADYAQRRAAAAEAA